MSETNGRDPVDVLLRAQGAQAIRQAVAVAAQSVLAVGDEAIDALESYIEDVDLVPGTPAEIGDAMDADRWLCAWLREARAGVIEVEKRKRAREELRR